MHNTLRITGDGFLSLMLQRIRIMDIHRHTYYGLIHHGIKTLLVDRVGHFTEMEYHQYLSLMTGKSSCFSMSDDELKGAVDNLRNEGYLEDMKSLIPRLEATHFER